MFLETNTIQTDSSIDYSNYSNCNHKEKIVASAPLVPGKRKGTSSSSDYKDFVSAWSSSINQLMETLKPENYSPDLEVATRSSVFEGLGWMSKAYDINADLGAPSVVAGGDGGLDIEWSEGDKFISLQIKKDSSESHRIYFEEGNNFGSVELTEENLKERLNWIQ